MLFHIELSLCLLMPYFSNLLLYLQIEILDCLTKQKDEKSPTVVTLVRDKADKDAANIKTLVAAIKDSKNGKTIGVYAKEKFSSELVDAWKKAIKEFEPVRKHCNLFDSIIHVELLCKQCI